MTGAAPESVEARFDALRPYLLRLAYSQLGSLADADDVVQEAWLRLQRTDADALHDLRAWLSTVVGRLALDLLGSARARREAYVGEWLPEPVVGPAAGLEDPAERAELDEAVSFALLAVLERLSPPERTAFVLHDVFGMPFEEVAAVVGRTPEATRQLAARARRHVREERPRFPATPAQQRAVIESFATAAAAGDLAGLLAVLDPGVVFTSDGGGKVPAARKPLLGAPRVARALLALARTHPEATAAVVDVNGAPGLLVRDAQARTVMAFTLDAGRIVAIDVVRNPDKLRRLPAL